MHFGIKNLLCIYLQGTHQGVQDFHFGIAFRVLNIQNGADIHIYGLGNFALCEIQFHAGTPNGISQRMRIIGHYNSPQIYSTMHLILIVFIAFHLFYVLKCINKEACYGKR